MSTCRFLFVNGVISQSSDVPQVSTFLETHSGAYTTTRSHRSGSCILFWERHLKRIAESAEILAERRPDLLFGLEKSRVLSISSWESVVHSLVDDSLRKVLPVSLQKRSGEEELAITTLLSGISSNLSDSGIDVFMHIGMYVPPIFGIRENGAHLAVVGRGRDLARAKFSEWVRTRKGLEKLRPPLANELLLSNDGDQILEGCVTNFFVVCRKGHSDHNSAYPFEVQTAPVGDGVLPGVIRQIVIEVCSSNGIPIREIAPYWSQREHWEEAFVTSSLRLVQHVETIRAPSSWEMIELKTANEVNWEEKRFLEGPGFFTSEIQRGIMRRADLEESVASGS